MIQQTWDNDFIDGANVLLAFKPKKKILSKVVEELNELSTKLIKEVNNPGKVDDNEIKEEIVDVGMNIFLLMQIYGIKENDVREKVDKFLKSKAYQKYLDRKINKENVRIKL